MPDTDDYLRAQESRSRLSAALDEARKSKRLDIVIRYEEILVAFPGGSHPNVFNLQQIDMDALGIWTKELGWDASVVPDKVNPDRKNRPSIRFTFHE